MARPTVKDRVNVDEVIPKLQRRTTWPVAMLADMLGCGRMTIYRQAGAGNLSLDCDGVDTASIIQWLRQK